MRFRDRLSGFKSVLENSIKRMLSGLDTGKIPCLYQIPVYRNGANILPSLLHI